MSVPYYALLSIMLAAAIADHSLRGLSVTFDLTTSISGPVALHPGDPAVYSLTVANIGASAATNVTATLVFPNSLSANAVAAPVGDATIANNNKTVTWLLPSLGPGVSVVLTINATAGTLGSGLITSSVSASRIAGSDSNAANNANSLRVRVDNGTGGGGSAGVIGTE